MTCILYKIAPIDQDSKNAQIQSMRLPGDSELKRTTSATTTSAC